MLTRITELPMGEGEDPQALPCHGRLRLDKGCGVRGRERPTARRFGDPAASGEQHLQRALRVQHQTVAGAMDRDEPFAIRVERKLVDFGCVVRHERRGHGHERDLHRVADPARASEAGLLEVMTASSAFEKTPESVP